MGLFSRVEGSEHYEKIFFKLIVDSKADSCLLDILLIQDIGKIEDTLHIVSLLNVALP